VNRRGARPDNACFVQRFCHFRAILAHWTVHARGNFDQGFPRANRDLGDCNSAITFWTKSFSLYFCLLGSASSTESLRDVKNTASIVVFVEISGLILGATASREQANIESDWIKYGNQDSFPVVIPSNCSSLRCSRIWRRPRENSTRDFFEHHSADVAAITLRIF
jgi:hypothetical protein